MRVNSAATHSGATRSPSTASCTTASTLPEEGDIASDPNKPQPTWQSAWASHPPVRATVGWLSPNGRVESPRKCFLLVVGVQVFAATFSRDPAYTVAFSNTSTSPNSSIGTILPCSRIFCRLKSPPTSYKLLAMRQRAAESMRTDFG